MNNTPSREAEIPRVVGDLNSEVEKLSVAMDDLFGRLLCICNSDSSNENKVSVETRTLQSSLAIKIDEIRMNVANLVDRIQERISRLEL